MSRELRPADTKPFITAAEPVILEVGCNDGTDTNGFLRTYPKARLYCFEPDPRAIARFKRVVHSEVHRVTLTEAAVSDEDGMATFYGSSGRPPNRGPNASHYCRLPEWDLSGSLCRPTGHLEYSPWTTFPEDRQYVVRTVRLDTWLSLRPEINAIDFLWADVQGAEAKLIAGAAETLRRVRYLYTEFYDRPLYEGQPNLAELKSMLPQFTVVGIFSDNVLFCRLT